MAVENTAEVTWQGDLMSGSGRLESVGSGALDAQELSWKARAEGEQSATNPEELIAAAHAACFSMALSAALGKAGHPAESLSTSARVTFIPGTGITGSALDVTGVVPGMSDEEFVQAAQGAKENCPVSKALAGNVELSVTARLKS